MAAPPLPPASGTRGRGLFLVLPCQSTNSDRCQQGRAPHPLQRKLPEERYAPWLKKAKARKEAAVALFGDRFMAPFLTQLPKRPTCLGQSSWLGLLEIRVRGGLLLRAALPTSSAPSTQFQPVLLGWSIQLPPCTQYLLPGH